MATLESSLLSCTATTSPLSTDPSSLRKPGGFLAHSFALRSSGTRPTSLSLTSASEQKNPEPKLYVAPQNTARYDNPSTSELGHTFSLLRNEPRGDFRQIHAVAVKSKAFEADSSIGNKLVALYSRKAEFLGSARKVFDEIPKRTKPGYAALISGYCRLEKWEDMFLVFGSMVDEGLSPDKYVLPTVLKACSSLKMTKSGKMIHGHVARNNDLDSDIFIGNSLIDFYANCGDLRSSRRVFDSMGDEKRDVVSWTSLVTAYMDAGSPDEGTRVFRSMQANGLNPDLISWNAFVSGLARNGAVDSALWSLLEMQERGGVRPRASSWNGVISGCVQNKYFEDALDAFRAMLGFPEDPNAVTVASVLPACAGLGDLGLGKAVHGFSLRRRLIGNVHVAGSLINMYSKCGRSTCAETIFSEAEKRTTAMWNEMIVASVNARNMARALELLWSMRDHGPEPDLISYNTVLAGYARDGKKDEAYELLSEMIGIGLKPNIISFNVLVSGFQQSGLSYEALKLFQAVICPSGDETFTEAARPNPITTTSALAACAHTKSKRQGKEIHGYSVRAGFERNTYVSTALVHMYSKCHDAASATKVFARVADKNMICWNAVIAGNVNNEQPEFALELFREMISEGAEPSAITIMIALLACGDTGALRSGREVHGYVLKRRFEKRDENLANALIGMYAKCGRVAEAKSVFNVEVKDINLWNATLSTYSVYGIAKTAVALFEQLELAGILPQQFC